MTNPETEKERHRRILKELEGKNISQYSVMLTAYIKSTMDIPKISITLSSAGIAILFSVISAIGVVKPWIAYLYVSGFIGFLLSICSSLAVYRNNSQHLEHQIKQVDTIKKLEEGRRIELVLEAWRRSSAIAFIIGLVSMIAIGVVTVHLKR